MITFAAPIGDGPAALSGTVITSGELERLETEATDATGSAVAIPEGLRVRGTSPLRGAASLGEKANALAGLLHQTAATAPVLKATAAWLQSERRTSDRTQGEYMNDLAWWITYLQDRDLTPESARATDADLYAAAMRSAGLSPATRARRLSAVSSWYAYLQRAEAAALNPFQGMERPAISAEASTTRGLSKAELETLLAYARKYETARTYALLCVMVATGCRVGGVVNVDLAGYGYDRGYCVLDLPVKGPAGKTKRMVMPPFACEALDTYLDTERGREDGPLFPTRTGKRMDQPAIFRLLQRVAKSASIAAADDLSPHSLRHSVITMLLDQGVPLHVVQDFAGHADPRTTRIYDQKMNSLERSPAFQIGTLLADGLETLAPAA